MNGNPLTDALTPVLRRYLYAALFVAGLAYAAWQASDGNWKVFIPAVIASLLGALAASNVDTSSSTGPETPPEPDPVVTNDIIKSHPGPQDRNPRWDKGLDRTAGDDEPPVAPPT